MLRCPAFRFTGRVVPRGSDVSRRVLFSRLDPTISTSRVYPTQRPTAFSSSSITSFRYYWLGNHSRPDYSNDEVNRSALGAERPDSSTSPPPNSSTAGSAPPSLQDIMQRSAPKDIARWVLVCLNNAHRHALISLVCLSCYYRVHSHMRDHHK